MGVGACCWRLVCCQEGGGLDIDCWAAAKRRAAKVCCRGGKGGTISNGGVIEKEEI